MNPIKRFYHSLRQRWHSQSNAFHLAHLADVAHKAPRYRPGEICFGEFRVAYTDMLSWYMEYKDIFVNRIYHFETNTPSPYIVDGGGYIGMSVLYFKSVYPEARIVCFEPDEDIFKVLQANVVANCLKNVELVQAGLADTAGVVSFQPDGADGGRITHGQGSKATVKTVRLSDYLTTQVDFLKLNIEGQELPVLEEAASGRLRNVRELVLEYHGWPHGKQCLGDILTLLDRQGFRYLVHDFDAETCAASKPPFRLAPQTTWFCLVYARRMDD